jgi:uncharacterized protein (TIGR03435 family)
MKVKANPGPITLTMQNVTLKFCIEQAYSMKEFQVSGPGWISNSRYDITATLPAGSTPDQVWPALQALLVERLQLVLRRDTREMRTYRLSVGKYGPHLRPSGEAAPDREAPNTSGSLKLNGATLAKFCDELSGRTGHLVTDATAIEGKFDFDLNYAKSGFNTGPPIDKALEDQLGLRLEPRRALVDVMVVERAAKVPVTQSESRSTR